MPPRYFKPEIMVDTLCEHCGARHRETFMRLYSDTKLICTTCGQEHTAERSHFRRTVDETESMVDTMAAWSDRLTSRVRTWWKGTQAE